MCSCCWLNDKEFFQFSVLSPASCAPATTEVNFLPLLTACLWPPSPSSLFHQVGLAEVHVALGRLAAGAGEASASSAHFTQAVGHHGE
jgi:hypothetical protein